MPPDGRPPYVRAAGSVRSVPHPPTPSARRSRQVRRRHPQPSRATTASMALVLLASLCAIGVTLDARPAAATTQQQAIVDFAAPPARCPLLRGWRRHPRSERGQRHSTCAPGTKGYDCMSLPVYAVWQATGIALPSNGTQPSGVGTFIPPGNAPYTAALLPGDVVYWGGTIDDYHHSAVYAGNGEVWDDFGPGSRSAMHTMAFLEQSYTYDGAYRFWNGGQSVTPPPPGPPPSTPPATTWSVRRRGVRLRRAPSTAPCPGSGWRWTTSPAWCRRRRTTGTGWWAPTAGCSPSTPPS